MKKFDFIVAGCGIFGACTAYELLKDGYSVCLIEDGDIPHPLAASTDISKVVRMEYGSDTEYMNMAIEAMKSWRLWNDILEEPVFHEVGYLLLSQQEMSSEKASYEWLSFNNIMQAGFKPQRLDRELIKKKFPAFNSDRVSDGFYHDRGGFAESGRAVASIVRHNQRQGCVVREGFGLQQVLIDNNRVTGIKTRDNLVIHSGQVILCTGNFTPYLLPELRPYMRVTGHPVFHLKPKQTELYTSNCFPVFAADISNTGYYGFPVHPREGVVKVAKHSHGLILDPRTDERKVTAEDEKDLRSFLSRFIPDLADAIITYTRRCCYTDTLDGHFWIDRHPEINGLTIGTGGSGHGFKMGPVVGEMITSVALGDDHKWSDRYRWRELEPDTVQLEEARFLDNRIL